MADRTIRILNKIICKVENYQDRELLDYVMNMRDKLQAEANKSRRIEN